MKNTIIVGGGISGLITAIQIARAGLPVTLIEKKEYPFHRVCGEYISRETIPFLNSLGLYPENFSPPQLSRFQLTSINGKMAQIPLAMGGFGISRYEYDQFLYQRALDSGVHVITGKEVTNITFKGERFMLFSEGAELEADLVIGSFGKRSRLDVQWGRNFIKKKSPYAGVKYHILTEHPPDLIALHNFKDGYCGISNIENGKTNLCYLTHRDNLRKYRNIREMEEAVLFRNPFLKSIFANSSFLFKKPETINEISFETKGPIENHVLLTGDAAGMITPLCGNGMAMAIRSSKILAALSLQFLTHPAHDRKWLEREYTRQWRVEFGRRLWSGRQIQRLFGKEWTSNLAVNMMIQAPALARFLVAKTHGDLF